MSEETKLIAIDQVRIGMFIKLDLSWFEHSFPMSSFKITNENQINELFALKVKHIRYVPAKTDLVALRSLQKLPPKTPSANLIKEENSLADSVPEETTKVLDTIFDAKKARYERLQKLREEIDLCEEKFVHAGMVVKNINKTIFSQPKETLQKSYQLIDNIAEILLSGNDAIMHAMQHKEGSEELYFHALNVSVLAMMLAHEIKCSEAQIKAVGFAALFHDIGKLSISPAITKKTTPLTQAEKNIYDLHGKYGVDIGEKAGIDKITLDVIANHHEYLDGSGFPNKLKSDAINLPTRIVSIANVYDNLCNHIDPNQSLTPHEALSLMYAHRRAQFDPTAMATLVKSLGVYPPGTLVRLSNDAVGLVMSVNVGAPLRPRVLVYDEEIPKEDAIILDLSVESKDLAINASIRPGLLPRQIFDYLSPRKRISYYIDAKTNYENTKPGGGR